MKAVIKIPRALLLILYFTALNSIEVPSGSTVNITVADARDYAVTKLSHLKFFSDRDVVVDLVADTMNENGFIHQRSFQVSMNLKLHYRRR